MQAENKPVNKNKIEKQDIIFLGGLVLFFGGLLWFMNSVIPSQKR